MALERPDDLDLERETVRWMRWGAVLLFIFALAFPVYRAIEPNRRAEAFAHRSEQLAAQGAELFELNCAQCHGVDGRGGLAPALNSIGFLSSATDAQISQLVAGGVPGSSMSPYSIDFGGPMTLEQIEAMVVFLRSQEEDAPDNPVWRTPLANEDLSGRELFGMACASCHGFDLRGTDTIPAVGPRSEAVEESDARIIRQIAEGKDEMPGFGNVLTAEQIDRILAYLRQAQAG